MVDDGLTVLSFVEQKIIGFSNIKFVCVHFIIGGKEGVLVLWQLDTGKKKFLPRIGSPLRYFVDSLDPSFASVRITFM